MQKRIAVFQHLDVEHPGIFRDFLHQDDIAWQAFELDEGEVIPDLSAFDALWVMGGPMDVWQEAEHPWLIAEKAAIKHAVCDLDLPFLGVCLGHQLFAESLGGVVKKSEFPEVGVCAISFTTAGKDHGLFTGFEDESRCLQWHGAEVAEVPPALHILASSSACRVQALARGSHQVSIQFHIEVTSATVNEWGAVPAYEKSLKEALGENGLAEFGEQTEANLQGFNRDARIFYENWKRAAGF